MPQVAADVPQVAGPNPRIITWWCRAHEGLQTNWKGTCTACRSEQQARQRARRAARRAAARERAEAAQ